MTARRLGPFLALWSAAFALVHAAWALGWRGGVPAGAPPISERPVFLAYDVTAGLLMLAAAYVAVRLAHGGLPHRTRERLVVVTVVGSVLALLRGVPALAIDLGTGTFTGLGPAVDGWFTVAGATGLLLARRAQSSGTSRTISIMAEPSVKSTVSMSKSALWKSSRSR